MTKFFRGHLRRRISLTCNENAADRVGDRYPGSGESCVRCLISRPVPWLERREEVSLMYPRRTSRRSRRLSGSRHPTRRLWLIGGATCVPLLIVAYALVMANGESATNAAYVSGTIAHGA